MKLSDKLRSDTLENGEIEKRFDLAVSRSVHCFDLEINRDDLFNAFRQLFDGSEPDTVQTRQPEGGVVGVEIDGHDGLVVSGDRRFRFENAAMLSSLPERRLAAAEDALRKRSLCKRDSDALRSLLQKPDFDAGDFGRASETLASAPEEFIAAFQDALRRDQVSERTFLPEDPRHWDHITAPLADSGNIEAFLAAELGRERVKQLGLGHAKGLKAISLTFSAPEMVPDGLLDEIPESERWEVLERAADISDPFGLVGLLKICAEYLEATRVEALGARILSSLFSDMVRLRASCDVFAAAFVIATAHLAVHQGSARTPVFWRRLAAHAHGSLIVRSVGSFEPPKEDLVAWALRQCQPTYIVSILNDLSAEPRWRPEWIAPDTLVADVYGRARGILAELGEGAPQSWKSQIEAAEPWLGENNLLAAASFPSIGQGARRKAPDLGTLDPEISSIYQSFADAPSLDGLLNVALLTYALGPPAEMIEPTLEIVRQIGRSEESNVHYEGLALTVAGYIAACLESEELGDSVAETSLLLTGAGEGSLDVASAVRLLFECSAASQASVGVDKPLYSRLESLAFKLEDRVQLSELMHFLTSLRRIDTVPSAELSRAYALAELGSLRAGR